MVSDTLELLVGVTLTHHAPQADDILQVVSHPGVGRLAITPGTAGFLVIGFEALGHIEVCDKAHIRLVDAHAEGNGGNNDHALFAQETRLVFTPHVLWQSGVVWQGHSPLATQPVSDLLNLVARQAVNNPGSACVLTFDKTPETIPWTVTFTDGVTN